MKLTEQEREKPVEIARNLADTLQHYADQIRLEADRMAEDGDAVCMAVIANSLRNCLANLRLDLLVKYSYAAFERRLDEQDKEAA